MKLVVDGNDGTGKSTLVATLQFHGLEVSDRGIPTKMTDSSEVTASEDEFYLILDAPVEISRARLAEAGRDLNEKYHTVEDLTHYRQRFIEVAEALGDKAVLVDARGTAESVAWKCLEILWESGLI